MRINLLGLAPRIRDSGNGVRADYSAWTMRFSDGTERKDDPVAVYPTATRGMAVLQTSGVEDETTQYLIASKLLSIAYTTAAGRVVTAYYSVIASSVTAWPLAIPSRTRWLPSIT